jgi:acetyl esterase/lipase
MQAMNIQRIFGVIAAVLLAASPAMGAPNNADVTQPITQFFAKRSGISLRAIVYRPEGWKPRQTRPVVVIFHGLDWTSGLPEWSAATAKHYASQGMVAVSAQYRVANDKVTPLDSMADARDAIRWVRVNAAALGIDPSRIAAHGFSSGAHLALSAATVVENASVSASPNALILFSPPVDVEKNQKLQAMLGTKATAASISPINAIRKGLPPTTIMQGDVDTVTPHASAKSFCDKMVAAGNRCELNTYLYAGHLFTPKGTSDANKPQPNAKIEAAAQTKADVFLASLGYTQN